MTKDRYKLEKMLMITYKTSKIIYMIGLSKTSYETISWYFIELQRFNQESKKEPAGRQVNFTSRKILN